MAYCTKCGSSINPQQKFCHRCGSALQPPQASAYTAQHTPPPATTPYTPPGNVSYTPPPTDVRYAPSGGGYYASAPTAVKPPHADSESEPAPAFPSPDSVEARRLLTSLSTRIKIESIIWFVIAGFQAILGITIFIISVSSGSVKGIFYAIFLFAVALSNVASSSQDLSYTNTIMRNPIGIVEKFSPVDNIIRTLIYNIIFGGIIGIGGCIYSFIVRNFVLSNQASFRAINNYVMKEKSKNKSSEH